jgi:murein DD-endopeptidase MepM/ murein hydrolase activator NlpD
MDQDRGAATADSTATVPAKARRSWRRRLLPAIAVLFVASMVAPDRPIVPVQGASVADWHPQSFWHHPWGASGVHKGIDIFAPEGRPVLAATSGFVVFSGRQGAGGNVAVVLGPRWRLHYYAHLREIGAAAGSFVAQGDALGTVGTTGNAAGRPPHLHYTVLTLPPYPWRVDSEPQGWKKMFYLDPGALLTE